VTIGEEEMPPKLSLTFRELLEHREVQLENHVISWYSTTNTLEDNNGYSGQDKSCLRYLHLPKNLDKVHFDLNLSHPDDEYKQEELDQTDNINDLLSWIKDFGIKDDR